MRRTHAASLRGGAFALLILLTSGCSREFESKPLGLTYEPPSGMALAGEEPGPPAIVRFGDGLELRVVPADPPPISRESIPAILEAAGVKSAGAVLNAQEGTLTAGKVLRFELDARNERELYYFVPREERFVLVRFAAPTSRYGQLSAKVERSLSSLQVE